MTNSSSPIEDFNKAIRSQNPFDKSLVVVQNDIWREIFFDIPSLNAHASEAVFEALEQVNSGQRSVFGLTITAEKGLGKSHIINRIRHCLQTKHKALFVYMSEYSNLNHIQSEFLQTLAFSLRRKISQNVSQWQELATALVNEATGTSYKPRQLVDEFKQLLEQNRTLVDDWMEQVLQIKPDIDHPDFISAILWTLSSSNATFAINWLSGIELGRTKADVMGLPTNSSVESFKAVRQILDIISDYRTPVICFDELDGAGCNEQGLTRAPIAASLAKDLYTNIKRGIFLMAMYPETWIHQVRTLPYAEAVIDRIGEKVIELKYLDSNDVITLVSGELKEFYGRNGLTSHPHSQVYPFDETRLRELGKQRATARDVLQWCQKHFAVCDKFLIDKDKEKQIEQDALDQKALHNLVENALKEEVKKLDKEADIITDKNKDKLSQAIVFGLKNIIGQTLEGVKIEEIQAPISPRNKYIDFKVLGSRDGTPVKIGVALLQTSNTNSLAAGLSNLADYDKFDLTCGCVLRSKGIPSTKTAQKNLKSLKDKGGKLVVIKEDEIKQLLAIWSIHDTCKDLNKEQILNFINKNKLFFNNSIIQNILNLSVN